MLCSMRNLSPKLGRVPYPTWPQHKLTRPKFSTDVKGSPVDKKVTKVIIDGKLFELDPSTFDISQAPKKALPLHAVCKMFLLRMVAVAAVAYAVVKIGENDKSDVSARTSAQRTEEIFQSGRIWGI